MKLTRWKYLFKSIGRNMVSFLNVALIASVGIAVLLGILSSSEAIQRQADRYFVSNKLQSLEIKCANGITDADLQALSDYGEIDIVEGGYSTKVTTWHQGEELILQVLSMGQKLNIPTVVEGSLPLAQNELAVEQKFADKRGIKVGDTLTLKHSGALKESSYTVTAIINQPMYCCVMGKETRGTSNNGMGVVAHYVMVVPEAFQSSFFNNCYSVARIRSDALDKYYYYSDDYIKEESRLLKEIETLGEERARIRYEELLEQAEPAIAAGLLEKDSITLKDWVVSNREDAGDLRGIPILVDTLNSISYSMSALFMLVVIVVCYTAISRMIDEQRYLIGTQKAQGFRSWEIMAHYMIYNTLCAIVGILIGWAISVFVIEKIVVSMLGSKFLVGGISLTFVWPQAWLVSLICLAVFLVTTYLTCQKVVFIPAVELLNAGKYNAQNRSFFFEKWKVYKNRTLFVRIMIKNVLGDKKRLITTIIGIMGSVTLMVICFSLKLAIDGAFERQFETYFFYENRLVIDSDLGNPDVFTTVLEKEEIPYIAIQDKLKNFRIPGEKWASAHILAIDPSKELEQFMYLEDAKTGHSLSVPDDGVLVSRKCAEIYGLKAGDFVEVADSQGGIREFRVSGIMEHYISFTYFVTSTSYYQQVMDEPADECVFLLRGTVDGLREQVQNIDGFMSLKDNSDFKEDISLIYIVIAICLVLSAAMTFLVILNQIVMYIDRKAIELAVMRINGYTIGQTKAFIYRDNIALTILGLIFGSVFGMGLSYVMIHIMEREIHHYVRIPNILSCLYAAIITCVFVLIVNILGLRRIHRLNLTDVNAN